MAWLERDARTGHYKVGFRLGERKLKKSLRTENRGEALSAKGVVEQTILAIERGWTVLPPNVDVGDFLLSGGRLTSASVLPRSLTLEELFGAYFASMPEGRLEESTIDGLRIHEGHLYRLLGKSYAIQSLTTVDLQRYVDKRSKDAGLRGRKVTPNTIKKAIHTLKTAWIWGCKSGLLSGKFPCDGVLYPKGREKPRFQTWKEIELTIARGGLSKAELADLWEVLFLTLPEIEELLSYVKVHARESWLYVAMCLAAHTGARRSEIVRLKLNDIDLATGVVTIHERKRSHSTTTTRRVPISPFLAGVLGAWLEVHPGGASVFCKAAGEELSWEEASRCLKRSLKHGKWAVVRGWHIFRHSFCSNCAAKGIDQRIINSWVGHQTEAMVRRYRHLVPDQQQQAIVSVFGSHH